MTQEALAAELDVDRTAVVQWESKRAERRSRPEVARLEALAKATSTPLWWLLSDESDPTKPWPKIANEREEVLQTKAAGLLQHLQDFWSAAALRTRELRPDLWAKEIWTPGDSNWANVVSPSAATDKAIVTFAAAVRIDMDTLVSAAGKMLVFERLTGTAYPAKAILVWRPDPAALPDAYRRYLDALDRTTERAAALLPLLGIEYVECETIESAATALVRIL